VPLLFSYGTLREPDVQRSIFGRLLKGHDDALVGFELALFKVEDAAFVASSGKAMHNTLRSTGRSDDRVPGVALEVTDSELLDADRYEPAGYVRIATTLASGKDAWVYIAH
jgi:hypothetical protein